MSMRSPKVVAVMGGLPEDTGHLAQAAEEVDLTVYRSGWMPPRAHHSTLAPTRLPVRSFRPLLRTSRGHLAFVFPGLARALGRDRPNVVHVVSEPWGLLGLQAAAWVRRHPGASLVLHGCDTIWHHGPTLERRARRLLLARTLPTTSAYLAENAAALDLAGDHGLPTEAIRRRVHTNPRDQQTFNQPSPGQRQAARRALGLAQKDEVVTLLGRLTVEKGVQTLLDAFAQVTVARPQARLVVAGRGPLESAVARSAGDRVRFLGPVNHPDGVLQALHASDVVACPSWATPEWEDQGPRVVIEGMMCGCVPVGTRTGGIPELLDGRGVLVPQRDAPALAAGMVEALGISARAPVRHDVASHSAANYSTTATAAQLVDVWRAVARTAAARLVGHGQRPAAAEVSHAGR